MTTTETIYHYSGTHEVPCFYATQEEGEKIRHEIERRRGEGKPKVVWYRHAVTPRTYDEFFLLS